MEGNLCSGKSQEALGCLKQAANGFGFLSPEASLLHAGGHNRERHLTTPLPLRAPPIKSFDVFL